MSRAFGLAIELGFPVPGLPPTSVRRLLPDRRVALRLAAVEDAERWVSGAGEVLVRQRLPGGRGHMVLERCADGLLLHAPEAGTHLIDSGANTVHCAPVSGDGGRWHELLTGQVLPLVAVLRGLEVLHASAVTYRDTAIAFCGRSGAGKTAIAASLVARGASILTDDVLALEARGSCVVAHPGPRLLRMRGGAGAVPLETARPVPLSALCVVDRAADGELEIRRVRPTASMLLGTTFNFAVTTPQRLAAQLDLHARLAQSVAVIHAQVPPGADPAAVGMRLEAAVAAGAGNP